MLVEYFQTLGLNIQKDLRENLRKHNRNASGRTSDSINFEVSENKDGILFQIVANSNIRNLQEGRGKTEKSGSGGVKRGIAQWIKDKGIKSEIKDSSLIFLITRKIHREGYKGTQGLISDVINDELIESVQKAVADLESKEFSKNIKV